MISLHCLVSTRGLFNPNNPSIEVEVGWLTAWSHPCFSSISSSSRHFTAIFRFFSWSWLGPGTSGDSLGKALGKRSLRPLESGAPIILTTGECLGENWRWPAPTPTPTSVRVQYWLYRPAGPSAHAQTVLTLCQPELREEGRGGGK